MVISNWVTLVVGEEAGPDRFKWSIQCLSKFFYANDGLLASPRPARIQAELDVLMILFVRIGLQTSMNKMFGMV